MSSDAPHSRLRPVVWPLVLLAGCLLLWQLLLFWAARRFHALDEMLYFALFGAALGQTHLLTVWTHLAGGAWWKRHLLSLALTAALGMNLVVSMALGAGEGGEGIVDNLALIGALALYWLLVRTLLWIESWPARRAAIGAGLCLLGACLSVVAAFLAGTDFLFLICGLAVPVALAGIGAAASRVLLAGRTTWPWRVAGLLACGIASAVLVVVENVLLLYGWVESGFGALLQAALDPQELLPLAPLNGLHFAWVAGGLLLLRAAGYRFA